ncbi:hypothetical protein M9Y10_008895 [Tritrichomonas musculus]|uniref:Uncharacterized protein n=1 Tax=Tritrichomonas musculus TaxID=1915356 RepID=A0ABR2J193_9EUKA
MFNHYRHPKTIGLNPQSKYWAQHPGYNRSTSKIDGKNYICDFFPLQNVSNPRFPHILNEALSTLSNRPSINVPILPISFWTLISVGDPTPAHLIVFIENNDGKLSLDELENTPSKAQNPVSLNPTEKGKVAYIFNKTCEHVSKSESPSSLYLHLTEHCVFYNQNKETFLSYYGIHLLKDFITPECYSKFFVEDPVSIDSKLPPYLKTFGKLHCFLENLGEPVPIPFEQSIVSNVLKKTQFFDKQQPKSSAMPFITSCFDQKAKLPLTFKGCKPKEFAPFAQEINIKIETQKVEIDSTQKYKVSPDPSLISPNNLFSKFMSSFVIPYPDDQFRNFIGEMLQQHFSYILVKYIVEYSFSAHIVKRGPRLHEINAFNESQGLLDINQEFIDQLKKASLLGSLNSLFRMAHFALFKYDSEPPEELLEILKTAGESGNFYANIDYGLYLSMKNYLEHYNPNSEVKSEVVKEGMGYFERASKKGIMSFILMSFFCYLCNDNDKAVKYLQKIEKFFPSVTHYIKLLAAPASTA